jgi:quinoprotein glucose dehydrogenase
MRIRHVLTIGAAFTLLVGVAGGAEKIDAGDWPHFTRDLAGTRYSPLTEINTRNVAQLATAWTFRLRPEGGGAIVGGTTPIVVHGVMYLPLGTAIVALEADTGRELWRHPVSGGISRRGVSWWPGDRHAAPRIYYSNGRSLFALDAASGAPVKTFGHEGELDMGVPYNSAPTIYKDLLIVGANVQEMPVGPPGNSRAYDARTGAKLWEFHTVPQPGEVGHETWLNEGWKGRSGTNVWVWYMTVDEQRGLLYMPVGGPSANYYGGDRPGANLFGNSLVAVDAATGKLRWYFQTIHHDLWDSDLPAPPTLIDIKVGGKRIPALAETGKTAFMYILDRSNGRPVFGVEEKPVAAADVPGEWYSPTQPIPVKPARLVRSTWTTADIVTPEDTNAAHVAACHALLEQYGGTFFNAGAFTPFFLHEEGGPVKASINIPVAGGANWGGTAADPGLGYLFVNTTESASIGFMERRKTEGDYGRGTQGSTQLYDRASLSGPGAYTSFSASYTDAGGRQITLPCIRPPWGRLFAIDARTGEIAWETRLGVSDELAAGKQATGRLNIFGGPIVTAGGLVFIGATDDRRFRAFDSRSGKELWSAQLQYNAQSVPITYRGRDGRQYVAVVAAGWSDGARGSGAQLGDNNESLVVFALPRSSDAAPAAAPPPAVRELLVQGSMNVYRRFLPEKRTRMVEFYHDVLALRPLQPIDLGGGQQMILFGVGSAQVKFATGLKEGRQYHLGGVNAATGIRRYTLFFADEAALLARFRSRGYAPPEFRDAGDGTRAALVQDPGGFTLQLVVKPGATAAELARVEVGINVSDLERSRAFYRDFVGLEELPPVQDALLGVTKYPYRHGETTLELWSAGKDLPADTGSAGIQYVVGDADAVDARARARGVAVEQPLGDMPGFPLRTVWLNDPDGVTNYFAQVGPRSGTPRQ